MGVRKGTEAVKLQGPRHETLGLTADDVLQIYEHMLVARGVDERSWLLNRGGRIPFLVSCQGHEACQVGAGYALQRGVDYSMPYYRDIGVALVLGMTARDIMLGLFARAEDPSSGGRQMPSHFGSKKRKIISGSSPVGTQIPQAVGVALAARMRREEAICWVSFGEGVASKGDFHEGLNFAGIHKAPVIFFCENNQYAISVHQTKQMAIENVADRAAGYGFPGVVVDGCDPLAVYEATRAARVRAVRGEGPTLIEAKTYRFHPHSSDDDDRTYRSREEVQDWRDRDPIPAFRRYLEEQGILTAEAQEALEQKVADIVDDATDYAEAAPSPRPEDLTKHVYAE